ncbi:Serine/threonine-protein kinase 17A [Perkinsus olseni]|nr:Serine/threonine-protein kinase 17A [Perkinsus olseni]
MVRTVVANEVNVLEKLNHPNVCKPREFFEDEYFYYQVMQMYGPPVLVGLNSRFAPNVRYRNGTQPLIAVRLPEYRIADLIKSALRACAYIHSQRIVHRDIKGDNFLFESADVERGELVMVDFGLAVELHDDETLKKACGTVRYYVGGWPLEMLQEGYNSGSVDVWAVGVLLFLEMAKTKPTILTVAERKAKAIKRAAARMKIAERSTTDRISNQDHQHPVVVSPSENPAASSPSAGVGELSGRGDEDFISGDGPSWSVDGSAGMGVRIISKAGIELGTFRRKYRRLRRHQQMREKEQVAAEEPPKAGQGQPSSHKRALVSPSLFLTAAPSFGQPTEATPVDPLKFISLLPSTAERHRHHHRQLADDKDSTRGPKVKKLLRSVSVALKNDLDDDDDGWDVYEGEDGRDNNRKGGSLTRAIPAHFSRSRLAKDQLRQESKDYQVKADSILDKLNTEWVISSTLRPPVDIVIFGMSVRCDVRHMHGVKRGNRIADFVLNRSALAPGPNKNPLGNNRFISSPPNANTSSTTEMSQERAMMMEFRSVLPGEVLPTAEAAETQMQKRLSLEGLDGDIEQESSNRGKPLILGHHGLDILLTTNTGGLRLRRSGSELRFGGGRGLRGMAKLRAVSRRKSPNVAVRASDVDNTRLDRENRVLQRQLDQQRRRVEDMSDVLRYSREERQRLEQQGLSFTPVQIREADAALDESRSILDGNNAMKEMLAKELDNCRRDLHAVCLGVIEVGCLVPSGGGGMGKPGDSTQVILDRAREELAEVERGASQEAAQSSWHRSSAKWCSQEICEICDVRMEWYGWKIPRYSRRHHEEVRAFTLALHAYKRYSSVQLKR